MRCSPPEAESLQDRSWLTYLNFAPEPFADRSAYPRGHRLSRSAWLFTESASERSVAPRQNLSHRILDPPIPRSASDVHTGSRRPPSLERRPTIDPEAGSSVVELRRGARAPASRTRTGGPASVFSKRGKLKKPVGQQGQTSFWMICAIVSGVSSASLRRCSRCGQRSTARFYQQDCRGSRVLIGRW
jgi:hypothetical protein